MEKIKFAVVGFGHIGRRHATIINEYAGASLVAIVEPVQEQIEHSLYPEGVPYFSDIDAFLGAGIDCDVLAICTPNAFHAPYAIEAVRSGMHALIEKPMGLNRRECEKVISEALSHDRQVFVVKQNRYSPPVAWLKEICKAGQLGEILHVQINCYWNRDDRYYQAAQNNWKGKKDLDGGVLYTQFSHFIDIMHWVFGDVEHIHARMRNHTHRHNTEFDDSGVAFFDFVEGGTGCINFSTSVWDRNMESSITVIGAKGALKIGGQYMNEVEYCHIEDYQMPELEATNPPNDYGPFTGSAANHHYVIENVVNTLNGNSRITTNMMEGMKVVEIIERIYESAQKAE